MIMAERPVYAWGGSTQPGRGLDCSGYVFLAAKWAAIPGITRTTSRRMALGMGGWSGRDIAFAEADEGDLAFWTMEIRRPFGHVGVFLRDRDGMPAVAHASRRRGVTLAEIRGRLLNNLTKVRRLTIGE
jgi:cell wall-associated NlpC family hydrolase